MRWIWRLIRCMASLLTDIPLLKVKNSYYWSTALVFESLGLADCLKTGGH
jgi:hypothetical protein